MKFLATLLMCFTLIGLTACDVNDADVASRNISQAADNFEINRRVVFYNGFTDTYILTVEGLCSFGNGSTARSVYVICKTGPNSFKKHNLVLSDNVTLFSEQLEPAKASVYFYRVTFKPSVLLPAVDVR